MPSDRSRRCASTVKPPTATRAMSSIPTTRPATEIVCGLITLGGVCAPAAVMLCVSPAGGWPRPSNSTVTWVGLRTWPGTTRANSSSRLCGFCTMPTTVRAVPPWCHVLPILRPKSDARPLVTATWPGPAGKCPETSESIGCPYGPCGFWARTW